MSRLTEEMVIARSKQSDVALVTKLNCWGSDLSDVSILKRMTGVEVLALSVNRISTLSAFEDCKKLQELYLRKNNIQDIREISYLQNLPALKYLWLEENPCCDQAGPNYRAIVLRALPNLKKLDNVEVTQEEVDNALRDEGMSQPTEEDVYEDAYEARQQQQQQQQQHQQYQHQQQQQHSPHQAQQLQRPSASPTKELPEAIVVIPVTNNNNNNNNDGGTTNSSVSDIYSINQVQTSVPPTPTKEYAHPPSPKYNTITKEQRTSFTQYDNSPGSDQESVHVGYREVRPAPLPPSTSTHSMKEYYQQERPQFPAHYRHSQNDLTEWEEHQQHQQHQQQHQQQQQQHQQQAPQVHHNPYGSQMQLHYQRRSAGPEIGGGDRYGYRNGSARENGGDWEPEERPRSRRPEGRHSDSVSNVSMLQHYTGCHRRPVNRNSNILSATLCLIKELDCGSLEVLEHAVRCRIDELANE